MQPFLQFRSRFQRQASATAFLHFLPLRPASRRIPRQASIPIQRLPPASRRTQSHRPASRRIPNLLRANSHTPSRPLASHHIHPTPSRRTPPTPSPRTRLIARRRARLSALIQTRRLRRLRRRLRVVITETARNSGYAFSCTMVTLN